MRIMVLSIYNRVAMFWVELKGTLQTTEAEPKLEQTKESDITGMRHVYTGLLLYPSMIIHGVWLVGPTLTVLSNLSLWYL